MSKDIIKDQFSFRSDAFRYAMDAAPLGFCLVDGRDKRILYSNPDFGSMLLLGKKIEGQLLTEVLPDDFISYLFDHSLISFERELTVTRKGAAARWVKVMGEHLKSSGLDHYALWTVDVTSDKTVNERLTAALKESDALAEMKSNLLATMSHEIRTPMQAVFGFLEMIGEISKGQKNLTDMTDSAKGAASGLLEILDDVLDLAKLDASKMELDSFEVPVRTLARGVIEAISARSNINIKLIDEIADDVPFVIKGDPKRLRQVIMNFMTNAIKFTRQGSVTLKISTDTKILKDPVEKADGYIALRFEVVDTGFGMSRETCDKLFTPFTQADNSTTRQFGGTGLGLSICKKLVGLMNGELGVVSEEGKGSTFWFEIPTIVVSTDISVSELPSLEGLAVMVVEDHPMAVKEIQNSLRSMGADVESCSTYKEGLELVKRRPFDIAVIDQGLPDGLGLDLMKEIAEIRPSTGLVMYTVRDDYGLQHSVHLMGATYLAKPASRIGLGEAVLGAAKKEAHRKVDKSKRILLAEDNESVRDILQHQFSMLGVEVKYVENGTAAIHAMQEEDFSILITDLHMPELDGYGLVHHIRREEEKNGAEKENFPVVVLTADVQMAQRHAYLSEGFDECLLKPVSIGQLRQLLIRWGIIDEDEAIAAMEAKAQAFRAEDGQNLSQNAPQDDLTIDLKAMEEQMGAVDVDSVEMLGLFADLTQPLIEEIRTAFDSGNAKALEEAAHSLKGSARSACCMVLGDIAGQLQDDAHDLTKCQIHVEGIEAEFIRVKADIKTLVDKYSALS